MNLNLQLETVNKYLELYFDAWYKFINSWIVIKITDPSCVYQWRLQVFFNFKFIFCSLSTNLLLLKILKLVHT